MNQRQERSKRHIKIAQEVNRHFNGKARGRGKPDWELYLETKDALKAAGVKKRQVYGGLQAARTIHERQAARGLMETEQVDHANGMIDVFHGMLRRDREW